MTDVVIKSKIRIRRGLQADLEALPVGQKPMLGELLYTFDTNRLYVGVDEDTDPVAIQTEAVFTDLTPDGTERRYRGGRLTQDNGSALNEAGPNSLDIQASRTAATHVAYGSGAVCIGAQCGAGTTGVLANGSMAMGRGCTVNGNNALALGRTVVASGGSNTAIGNTLTNNVANTILVGHTGATMRGSTDNNGWIESIMVSASARTATVSAIADAPVGSLPAGYFGFRLNGNDLWVDANIGGTVRSRNLGALA
jgi:hypothetical protein